MLFSQPCDRFWNFPSLHQAGQSVRLFHREHKCYVVAKGSFAQDPVLTEDGRSHDGLQTTNLLFVPISFPPSLLPFLSICLPTYLPTYTYLPPSLPPYFPPAFSPTPVHCRKRQTDHGILKERSTSSDTYWQFEKGSNSLSGESLTWGEECRIKHMPTRCYLSVIDTGNGFKVKKNSRGGGGWLVGRHPFLVYGGSTCNTRDTYTQ